MEAGSARDVPNVADKKLFKRKMVLKNTTVPIAKTDEGDRKEFSPSLFSTENPLSGFLLLGKGNLLPQHTHSKTYKLIRANLASP